MSRRTIISVAASVIIGIGCIATVTELTPLRTAVAVVLVLVVLAFITVASTTVAFTTVAFTVVQPYAVGWP